MKKLLWAVAVLAAIYAGYLICFAPCPAKITFANFERLTAGMTFSQVRGVLGRPARFPGMYSLTFKDGKVVSINAKDNRPLWTAPSEQEGYIFVKRGNYRGRGNGDTEARTFYLGKDRRTIQAIFLNRRLAEWQYIGPKSDFSSQSPTPGDKAAASPVGSPE